MRNHLKSIVSDILVKEAGQKYVDGPDADFTIDCARVPIEDAAADVLSIYGHRNLNVGDHDVTAELGLKNKFDDMAWRRVWAATGSVLLGAGVGMSHVHPVGRILGATAGMAGGVGLAMRANARARQADAMREYAPSASIAELLRRGGYSNMSERQN